MPRALVRDVHAADDPIVKLAIAVTEAPWNVRKTTIDPPLAHHVVLQAAIFGHLNRIADAVDVPADYPDDFGAPHVDSATPMFAMAPESRSPHANILLPKAELGPALAAWRAHAFDRDSRISRRDRSVIDGVARRALGVRSEAPSPKTIRERVLAEFADIVTRAPWRMNPATYAPLRANGLSDDASVFDAVATASAAGFFARAALAISLLDG